ncbi:MAG: TolC family protein [Bacteroidales bacterium]|nr:TolC family protein [Bacteroidales bacterium]MDD3989721.1 TolC family protein [Bacteroidales bacterium]
MKRCNILPILFLLTIPLNLSAQKRWSLQECISYAWDNNLSIKQKEVAVEQSKNNAAQSRLEFIPSVNASASHNMNWGRSVNMQDLEIIENKLNQGTNLSLSASVALFEGLSKINDIKSKDLVKEISLLEVGRVKNQISVEIARAYLQVLLSKEILVSAGESLKSVEEQRARMLILTDAGSLPYGSLLEIDAQLAGERVQVVNAKNQVSNSLLALKQLLDLRDDSGFEIMEVKVDTLLTGFQGESVEKMFEISRSLPQIRSAELNLKNTEIQLNMAKGRLYPTLSFSAGYGTYYNDSREQSYLDQFNENRNPSVGLSLQIPIFNSGRLSNAVKNSKLELKNSEIMVKSAEQALFKEIQQANSDALAYYERFRAGEQNVRSMEESFRYVESKFDLGALNATDYTVARSNLFRARSELSQAKYQFVFQLKILDFYKGVPISL